MSNITGSTGSENDTKPDHHDYLRLWLNYEDKMDELRSSFLTVAGLLFTLQSVIFALMLDKIFLRERRPETSIPQATTAILTLYAEYILMILSVLILIFFITIFVTYKKHIKRNLHRSEFVVKTCPTVNNFKNEINNYIREEEPKQKFFQSPWSSLLVVSWIYYILLLLTFGIPILRKILGES